MEMCYYCLHITKNVCRFDIFNYLKENNLQEIISAYISIYHSLLNECKSPSELTIKYSKNVLNKTRYIEI